METVDCRTTKQKFKDYVTKKKDEAKERAKRIGHWMMNNPEIVAGIGTATLGLSRFAIKKSRAKEEKELKNNYVYDRSGGFYWRLRRPLTTNEMLELDRRRSNGERTADILASMRVLK